MAYFYNATFPTMHEVTSRPLSMPQSANNLQQGSPLHDPTNDPRGARPLAGGIATDPALLYASAHPASTEDAGRYGATTTATDANAGLRSAENTGTILAHQDSPPFPQQQQQHLPQHHHQQTRGAELGTDHGYPSLANGNEQSFDYRDGHYPFYGMPASALESSSVDAPNLHSHNVPLRHDGSADYPAGAGAGDNGIVAAPNLVHPPSGTHYSIGGFPQPHVPQALEQGAYADPTQPQRMSYKTRPFRSRTSELTARNVQSRTQSSIRPQTLPIPGAPVTGFPFYTDPAWADLSRPPLVAYPGYPRAESPTPLSAQPTSGLSSVAFGSSAVASSCATADLWNGASSVDHCYETEQAHPGASTASQPRVDAVAQVPAQLVSLILNA